MKSISLLCLNVGKEEKVYSFREWVDERCMYYYVYLQNNWQYLGGGPVVCAPCFFPLCHCLFVCYRVIAAPCVKRVVCVQLVYLLDLSKAFDTLNHQIPIKKLEYFGLNRMSIKLMENYY